jgi:hypothetical protein
MAANKLTGLFATISAGEPISSRRLAALGISADLAVAYVRRGRLERLARGVFCRPGEVLQRGPTLMHLREGLPGLHVGGRTALEWHGLLPAGVEAGPLTLYGWDNGRLPAWFTARFPASYHRKRLIREEPAWPLNLVATPECGSAAVVSTPERALLELLSDVGAGVSLQEARRAAALAGALDGARLQALLQRCTSVKTVRLCVTAGQEFAHPWYAALVKATLPRGSARAWVGRSADGLLILPPI